MNDLMLLAAYKSLGEILNKLLEDPRLADSPELAAQVRNAIFFHEQVRKEFAGVLEENRALRERVSTLTRDPLEKI